jgi:hypothetical protein
MRYRDTQIGDKARQYQHAYYRSRIATPEIKVRWLVASAKCHAKRLGIAFDMSIMGLSAEPPRDCPICGRSLNYSTMRGFKDRNSSPSLDRVIPQLGYTTGNVFIICFRCNRVKNDGTEDDHLRIAAYIHRMMDMCAESKAPTVVV